MRSAMSGAAGLIVAGLLLLVISTPVHSLGTELNCMIFTYGSWDYEFYGGTSPCIKTLEQAKKRCGGSRVNFVPTHFWVDEEVDGTVDNYCYRIEGGKCVPVTQDLIDNFEHGMLQCMSRAVALGFDIEITPHIDDGLGKGGWRNALVFDPSVKYGGFSYVDMMIAPIARALKAAVQPETRVYFATQGEMSATVMRFPASWAALIPKIKQWVGGPTPASQKRVEVGVSTNFNKLCACVLMDLVDPNLYLKKLPEALKPVIDEFDIPAITKLYDEVDFIGMSNYASMPEDFTEEDLENAARQFAAEAKYFGIDLDTLLTKKGKKLHFSEYGVGGGTCGSGDCPAKTAAVVAKTPFFGIFGSYSKDKDPWQTPAVRAWMQKFYNRTIQWLKKKGGPTYQVDALYMWNLASWDVLAIHSSSTGTDGSYFDEEVSKAIVAYNAGIVAAKLAVVDPSDEGGLTSNPTKPADEIPTVDVPVAVPDNKTSVLVDTNKTAPVNNATTAGSEGSLLSNFFKLPQAEGDSKAGADGTAKPSVTIAESVEVSPGAESPAVDPSVQENLKERGEGSAVTEEGKARLQKKVEEARKALRETTEKVNAGR